MEPFIHGLLLALGLILPLGVQNLFIFNQGAIQQSYKRVLPATITASICDTLLILLAVLGVSVIIVEYNWLRITLMIVGILFLIYMGFVTWKSKPASNPTGQSIGMSAKRQILFALSVSLLNPHAILDTIGVIGASSLVYIEKEKIIFTATCIGVSWAWFHGLGLAGRLFKKVDSTGKLIGTLNKVSAMIIWITAIYMALTIVE